VSLPAAEGSGLVPPELAAEFAVLSVAIGAFFWIILGGMAGYLYGRANA
jgi:predicted cobalt transporter CbtA